MKKKMPAFGIWRMAGWFALAAMSGNAHATSQSFSLYFLFDNQTAQPVRLCSLSVDDCFPVAAHGTSGWMGNPEGDVKDAFLAWRSARGIDICGKRIALADSLDYSVSSSFWRTSHRFLIVLTEQDYARLCGGKTPTRPAGSQRE